MTEQVGTPSVAESSIDDVLVRQAGRVGRITLNRPKAINALTLPMIEVITATLEQWRHDPAIEVVVLDGAGDRGFCAGGDIRAVYDSALAGDGAAGALWRAEYRLDAAVRHYPKQVLSLLDGITMGGGVGIGCHRPLRVVTERSRLAMPEVRIGFAPDVAATLLFAQAPGRVGEHLALTGDSIGAADAIYCGLADHVVSSERLSELVSRVEAEAVDVVLADLEPVSEESAPEEPGLATDRIWIDECYSGGTVEEILQRLEDQPNENAGKAAAQIRRVAPLAAEVTLRAMQQTRRETPTIEQVLARDYRVMTRFLDTHDLRDGIRTMVVDKHDSPTWSPSALGDVTEHMLDRHFASLGEGELQV